MYDDHWRLDSGEDDEDLKEQQQRPSTLDTTSNSWLTPEYTAIPAATTSSASITSAAVPLPHHGSLNGFTSILQNYDDPRAMTAAPSRELDTIHLTRYQASASPRAAQNAAATHSDGDYSSSPSLQPSFFEAQQLAQLSAVRATHTHANTFPVASTSEAQSPTIQADTQQQREMLQQWIATFHQVPAALRMQCVLSMIDGCSGDEVAQLAAVMIGRMNAEATKWTAPTPVRHLGKRSVASKAENAAYLSQDHYL